jgi:hypothetical protein
VFGGLTRELWAVFEGGVGDLFSAVVGAADWGLKVSSVSVGVERFRVLQLPLPSV